METELIELQEEKSEENELIDKVREKHKSDKSHSEKFSDIFAVQLMLCIFLILVFVVINIFDNTITAWYIEKFKQMSMYDTEGFFRQAVQYVEGMLR